MDKAIYTKKEVKELVRAYKLKLKQKRISFDKLVLFGSYSRGNVRPWSDIDIAVVGKRFGENPIKEGVLLDEVADQVSFALEPHPINAKDFKLGSDPFILQIKKYGVSFA